MNPHVARGGKSFKGAFIYYLQDKGADTRERVEWTHTTNMMTHDPNKAWKVMAYTAKEQERLKQASGQAPGGRKLKNPVMAYSLSWHPEQDPSKEHMLETTMASLKVLGLQDHEAIVVAHRDTPHRHVHVVANRVHPTTGLVASDSHTYRKLSDFAREYNLEHGLEYCPQREENFRKRQEHQKTQYRDPNINEAWQQSDNGKSFAAALESRSYRLAQGRRGLVIINPYGKTVNPVRHIEGIKAKDYRQRLSDLTPDNYPDATALAKLVAVEHEERKKAAAIRLRQQFDRASAEPTQKLAKQPNQSKEPFNQAAKPSLEQTFREATRHEENSTVKVKSLERSMPNPHLLNRLQKAHFRQRDAIRDHHDRKIDHEKKYLSGYYNLAGKRSVIRELETKCESPSFFRRLFGLVRRDKRELETQKLNYQNAKMRFDERIETLKSEKKQVLDELNERQKHEWQEAIQPENYQTQVRHSSYGWRVGSQNGPSYKP